jgi:hypothetical protein
MRFLTVLGQPGKIVLCFSWTELRNEFSCSSSTNRVSSAWDDTHQNPVPAHLLVSPVSRYHSIYLLAVPNAIPSASFCSGKVPFLYQGNNPFSDWLVVVRHVEGMNRFVTSICEVMLVVIPSRFARCLLHSTSKWTCKQTGKLLLLRRIGYLEFQCWSNSV